LSFWAKITRKLASLGMVPRTRLAYFTLYLAGTEAVLLLLQWILKLAGAAGAAASLNGWTTFLGWVIGLLLFFLALRWFRSYFLWSVRNRLIVTYLFIGGVPVILLTAMAIGSIYVGVEQLATFIAISEIHTQEQRLAAANLAAVEEIEHHNGTPEQIAAHDVGFPGRSIIIVSASAAPQWLKSGFASLVTDQGHAYLRAAHSATTPQGPQFVISSVPFDQKMLARVSTKLGALSLTWADVERDKEGTVRISAPGVNPNVSLPPGISAGSVPPSLAGVDPELDFYGMVQSTDWTTGYSETRLFLRGTTRLSALYSYLAASMGIWTGVVGIFLIGSAIALALVVLAALIIGISLTRRITHSVANLYRATQHINRGDFTHRIQVRERDQLATLQLAFNSMTESLERLIAEQKEKERLQSELEIAHEVQSQLFPQIVSGTGTLELYGICRPARMVSGDYYDFLSYGPDQVGIAVGDISGKGISAALLMATIHSAVRAYEQEQLVSVSAAAYGTDNRIAALESRTSPASPAQMLWLLNRHLFQSTQPEKYATLFLGFYDDIKHRLTYSNGGHLPPIVLSRDGSVRRLETGGTVVGLFPDCEYEEETVELYPGDIFIAFSDGMTEPENEFGEFGEARLIETIAAYRHLPLSRITEHAVSAVQDWIGSTEQPDDITLVLARRI
jgi:sigma-B regulation protein RsbU (phosphoserine phosphatase)